MLIKKVRMSMEDINGYMPLRPFCSVGAGTASWTIAVKNGREYFLKRFNSPKYVPSCLEYCRTYEAKKRAIYDAIRRLDNGNLVVIDEFFHNDTFYYISTQKVPESTITAENAYSLPADKLLVIMKTLVHCMIQLERGGIVHADLKPSNVMLKPTVGGYYSLKLIDFDSSFFVADPPADKEDLEGDMTYLSPEVLMCMCGDDVALTSKIDVFAVGIMFHEFLSNRLPEFNNEYDSVCEAVANGSGVSIATSIPESLRELIADMLSFKAEDRPDFEDVFRRLCSCELAVAVPHTSSEAIHAAPTRLVQPVPMGKNPWMKKAGNL